MFKLISDINYYKVGTIDTVGFQNGILIPFNGTSSSQPIINMPSNYYNSKTNELSVPASNIPIAGSTHVQLPVVHD